MKLEHLAVGGAGGNATQHTLTFADGLTVVAVNDVTTGRQVADLVGHLVYGARIEDAHHDGELARDTSTSPAAKAGFVSPGRFSQCTAVPIPSRDSRWRLSRVSRRIPTRRATCLRGLLQRLLPGYLSCNRLGRSKPAGYCRKNWPPRCTRWNARRISLSRTKHRRSRRTTYSRSATGCRTALRCCFRVNGKRVPNLKPRSST